MILVNKPKRSRRISFTFILIVGVLFFPLSLFLIWKRAEFDKNEGESFGVGYYISGGICLVFAIMFISSAFSTGLDGVSIYLILGLLSEAALFLISGKNITSNFIKKEKYKLIILDNKTIYIDKIAEAASTTYEEAKAYIQYMIDKGYLEGLTINESANKLVVPGGFEEFYYNNEHLFQESNPDQENDYEEKNKIQVITCKGCGSQNTIKTETVVECEYCGSKIGAE